MNSRRFHIVLYEPEIPPNTGNIIRLCANTGANLHLIYPLGFELDDKKLRRAGLDYSEWAQIFHYTNYQEFLKNGEIGRLFALTTKGQRLYTDVSFQQGDGFLLGPETRGLPDGILQEMTDHYCLTVPMIKGSRSLNLSNTAALVLYEAWRQQGFFGAKGLSDVD